MNIIPTKLEGCLVIEPTVFEDKRGYFFESFNSAVFERETGLSINFVQDNQSKSNYGVLRGLHFQKGKYAQAKLVRVLSGEVLDVAVDLREDSSTYGHHEAIILSAENKKQFFLPRGFAHGFVVLSESAEFYYKCDNFYNLEAEGGLRYDDSVLNINWMVPKFNHIISDKDLKLGSFDKLSNDR